ncbi:MAG: hypothetical protein ABEJ36_04630 [Candidatus Nanosalina sp.]
MTRFDEEIDGIYVRDGPPLSVHICEPYEPGNPRRIKLTKMRPPGENEDEADWVDYYFNDPEMFQKIMKTVKKLYPKTNWKPRSELLEEIEAEGDEEENEEKIDKLLSQYPSTIKDFLDSLDEEKLEEENVDFLIDIVDSLNETVLDAERQIKFAFSDLLERLAEEEDQQGYNQLEELLEKWRLLSVTETANELQSRLQFIEMFGEMVQDEDIYERRGKDSVHKALESNLWLFNESYRLMHSDRTIKTFIRDKLDLDFDEDSEGADKRPDFVVGKDSNHLVIVELKKPSHTLQKEDLDQLEEYKRLAQSYTDENFQTEKCYLVGNEMSDDLDYFLENREGFEVLTYTDLISNAKNRYREYLEKLHEDDKVSGDQVMQELDLGSN